MSVISFEGWVVNLIIGAIFLLSITLLLRYGKKLNLDTSSKILAGILALFYILYITTPYIYKECSTDNQKNLYWLLNNSITYIVIFILLVVVPSLLWYVSCLKNNLNKASKIFKTLILIIVLGLTSGIFWLFLNPGYGIGGGLAHIANGVNRVRTRNVRSIGVALMQYNEKNNTYPRSLDELVPAYISKIPVDPITNRPYEYAISTNAKDYVIKADFNNFAPGCYSQVVLVPIARELQKFDLQNDLDGKVYGLDCEDPTYCKGPEQFQ